MPEITVLKELVPQAPGLVVAVILAWMFLAYMKTREAAFNGIVVDIHRENIEARERMQLSIEACTRALAENSAVSLRQTTMMEKMLERIERCGRP